MGDSDVEAAIKAGVPWNQIPESKKYKLGINEKQFGARVRKYGIENQLKHSEGLVRTVCKDEQSIKKYYEDLLENSRKKMMLYPYHLADKIVKGLRVTPFKYYCSIVESMLANNQNYDLLPNFTAVDCLRLLDIGRNQYLELLHQCKMGAGRHKLFQRTATFDSLPSNPVDIIVEPWWFVETGCITDEDIKTVTEAEKETIDYIIDYGKQKVQNCDSGIIRSLYKKGLIYFEVPIEEDDHFVVSTLEGFVMNRVLGDFLEKLLYDVFVSIDERTSVKELSNILQIDVKMVKMAISLFCRLNLAKKKACQAATTPSGCPAWPGLPVEREYEGKEEDGIGGKNEDDFERLDSCDCNGDGKRVAFFFDSTLTAFLMMGNLSPDLKKHAVKMFEVGKLTNENLDEFLTDLETVTTARRNYGNEGEAKRYFDHALILRQTALSIRETSQYRCMDLIRCESLQALGQKVERFLTSNYALLISMTPLEAAPITSVALPHFGAPHAAVSSIWWKLFIYMATGCGPPSILYPRGCRVKRLPSFMQVAAGGDGVLMTSWGHSHIHFPGGKNILYALNDALLHTPVLIQRCGSNLVEKLDIYEDAVTIPFPSSCTWRGSSGVNWYDHCGLKKLTSDLDLNNSCGYVTMCRTNKHWKCSQKNANRPSSSGGEFLESPQGTMLLSDQCCRHLLEEELNNDANFNSSPSEMNSIPHGLPLKAQNNTSLDDWCLMDCSFGIPLFDEELNRVICQSLIQKLEDDCQSLPSLMACNNRISSKFQLFIETYRNFEGSREEFDVSKEDIPWPEDILIFYDGKFYRNDTCDIKGNF